MAILLLRIRVRSRSISTKYCGPDIYENGVDVLIDDPEVEEVTVIAPIAGG
jgi:hypothetical protein